MDNYRILSNISDLRFGDATLIEDRVTIIDYNIEQANQRRIFIKRALNC
jgi:hypothetical protein